MDYLERARQLGYTRQDIDLPEEFYENWDWKEVWSNGEHSVSMCYRDGMSSFRCVVCIDGRVYYRGSSNSDICMNGTDDANRMLLRAMSSTTEA